MDPKRILFVVPRFHTNLFFATKALCESGARVFIFGYKQAPIEDHSFVKPYIFSGKEELRQLPRIMQEISPDLIFLRKAKPLSGHVAKYARMNKLNILHYDLRPLTRRRSPYRLALHWLRGMPFDRVTPVRGLDRARPDDPFTHYLPWPVGKTEAIGRKDNGAGPLRVLCVGKLVQPRKNQDLLISAMARIIESGRARLTLVGSSGASVHGADLSHYRNLKELALKSAGSIKIMEDVPYRKMAEIYTSHDVCVLPAHGEILGIAPVESMAYGCVPVISNKCGSAGYIESGRNGFVFDLGRPETLSEILERLADDPGLVAKLGKAAQATAETDLSPAAFVSRVNALLDMQSGKAASNR